MNTENRLIMRVPVYIKLFAFIFTFLPAVEQVYSQQKIWSISEKGLVETTKSRLPNYRIQKESEDRLELVYSFETFSVFDMPDPDEAFQLIRIEGFSLGQRVGAPALPVKTEKVVIPHGKAARVYVQGGAYQEITDINIYPAQEPGTDGIQKNRPFRKDSEAYTINGFLPLKLAEITNQQTFRGVQLGYLQIRPVQYNAATRTLRIYKELKITIEFTDISREVTSRPRLLNTSAYDMLRNTVINKRTVPAEQTAAKAAYDFQPKGYLIITVPQFEAAVNTLAMWKRQLGYHVEVYSQASWSISQVKTLAANKYNGSSYDFEYLLLFGDQQHIPDYYYLVMDGDNPWHIYSTNYYACMDGPGDYVPEMAHGRISVNSADQAMLVVNKIINYEKDPPNDPNFYNRGLHAGYFQDSTFDGTSDYRYCRTSIEMYDYMTARGFDSDLILYAEPASNPRYFNPYFSGVTQVPAQYLRSNGYPWDGNKDDILAAWNEGRLYAFHRDHGLRDQWMAPYFHLTHMDDLNNGDKLPIVFSINCGTGHFTEPEPFVCFAEKLQRHPNGGAIGIVAATAETKSGYNDGLIIGMMDAIWSSPGIIPDMGLGSETGPVTPHGPIYIMGDVMLQGLLRMTETWGSDWADIHQYHLYHYFGDPGMQLWTQQPVQLTASHTGFIEVGATTLTLSGVNAPDAIVTLTVDGEVVDYENIYGSSGTIDFPALDESVEEITITISKHNYIPYIAELEVLHSPVPDFEADLTEFCAGGEVHFTDLSTGIIEEWLWETDPAGTAFVNGTNSHSQHPQIRFNEGGDYTISLTVSNAYGSETYVREEYILVHAIPSAPEGEGDSRCYDEVIPELSVTGNGVKWYAEAQLTTLLNEGETYTPDIAPVGTISFYSTQTINDCEGEALEVSLLTYPETEVPSVTGDAVCEYDTAFFTATGNEIRWYADSLGTVPESQGSVLWIYPPDEGEMTFYASNTENGCESRYVPCTVLVKPQPDPPVSVDQEVCEGDVVVMEAIGEHIYWYSADDPDDPLYFGKIYGAGILDIGTHSFLITQEIGNCTSEPAEVDITVHELPGFSLGADTSIYYHDTLIIFSPVEGYYTWSDGSTASMFSFVGSAYGLGNFPVWLDVLSENNCMASDTMIVRVDKLEDSLPVHFAGNVINVFPNPTSGMLKLEFLQAVGRPVKLTITDAQGRLVLHEELTITDPNALFDIQLTGISDGLYFMRIYNDDITYTLSFIKN